jgi:glycosyltransferase involved in cell wall biosynthesis
MPSATLRQWMGWADLFALASWREAFGLVGLEALAARTPVLLTRDSGLARMIPSIDTHDDGVGWVVEPRCAASLAVALEQALANRERLARMGRAGRSFVAGRFTWSGNARTILDKLDGATKGAR